MTFVYHGRARPRFEVARYRWPGGYHYRRYWVGAYLPAVYWSPDYFIEDYGWYGLAPPDPGLAWIRYGPDILLIDLGSGAIVDIVYGAFDEYGGYASGAPSWRQPPDEY